MNTHRVNVTLTTDASGDAVGYTQIARGRLYSINYTKPSSGGMTNATVLVTTEDSGQTLWSEASVNASAILAPRQPTHDNARAARLYAAGGTPVGDHYLIANERIKVVIAGGGNTLSGSFEFLVG